MPTSMRNPLFCWSRGRLIPELRASASCAARDLFCGGAAGAEARALALFFALSRNAFFRAAAAAVFEVRGWCSGGKIDCRNASDM